MTKPKAAGKYRGTAKRGKEKRYDCTVCGDKKGNLEVNEEKGVFSCWRCGFSGVLPGRTANAGTAGLERTVPGSRGQTGQETEEGQGGNGILGADGRLAECPELARLYIAHRGLDPEWVIREYGLKWDGKRLCWPTGGGWARRAINDWDEPKVKVDGLGASDGAIIGIERLARNPGSDVVITEGDFKAACIPLPWIGVGLMGHLIHDAQMDRIQALSPATVTLFEDADFPMRAYHYDLKCFSKCRSPFGGPDDIPMEQRVRLLLHAQR